MTIKKGDFIEIDYTATTMDDNIIFDTTNPEEAEKAGMICDHDHEETHNHKHLTKEDFKPITICVGEQHVLPGLDEQLIGLNEGEHEIILGEENAFGKKEPRQLKLMPMNSFKKQQITPFVGLTVDMDGSRGVVRSISGGRVIVDFNHPLAGKTVKYKIKINKKIEDKKEQIESLLKLAKLPFEKIDITENEAKIKILLDLPENVLDGMKEDMEKLTKTKIKFDIKNPRNTENLNKKETTKQEEKQK